MKLCDILRGKPKLRQRDIRAEWEASMQRHIAAGDVHILAGHSSAGTLCGKTMDWLEEHQPNGATCNPWVTTLQYTFPADFFADTRIPMATCPDCRQAWFALRQKAAGR